MTGSRGTEWYSTQGKGFSQNVYSILQQAGYAANTEKCYMIGMQLEDSRHEEVYISHVRASGRAPHDHQISILSESLSELTNLYINKHP